MDAENQREIRQYAATLILLALCVMGVSQRLQAFAIVALLLCAGVAYPGVTKRFISLLERAVTKTPSRRQTSDHAK